MTRFHVAVLVLASLAFSGYLAAWMWLLPDGFRCRFPSMDFIYLNWGESLLGALGLYAAVVIPTVLHALRCRWPFWTCLALSVPFGILNVGPLTAGFAAAEWASQPTVQVTSHDALWEVLICVGLLLLYLSVSVCFLSWAVWQRVHAEPAVDAIRRI